MYTQCSSCKTLFRITDEQLASVGGKVRCGFCYGTFNAYDALFEEIPGLDDPTDADSDAAPQAATRTDGPLPTSEDDASQAAAEETGEVVDADLEEKWPTPNNQRPLEREMPRFPAQTALPAPRRPVNALGARGTQRPALPAIVQAPSTEIVDQAPWPTAKAANRVDERTRTRTSRNLLPAPPRAASAPAPVATERVASPLFPFPASAPVPAGGPTFGTPEKTADRSTGSSELPRLFDAIDVAGRELQQVSRVQLDRRPRNRADATAESRGTLAWLLATLLLIAFIVIQYGYFMRNDLARFPQLRPWLEKVCEVTGCTIPLMYSPQLIKLVSRDIRTHPTESDALQVRARILNEAAYPQAYPVLSVQLSDVSGKVIASRLFQPTEYLPGGVDVAAGIAPKAQADIQLDLLDPSHAAVGFEFAFL